MIQCFEKQFESIDAAEKEKIEKIGSIDDVTLYKNFCEMIASYYTPTESNYFRAIYNNSNFQSEFKSALARYNKNRNQKINLLDLIVGLDDIGHLDIQKDLYRLSKTAEGDYIKERAIFLERHYHHADFELDISTPRWGEKPGLIDKKIELEIDDPTSLITSQKNKFLKTLELIESRKMRQQIDKLRYFLISRERLREYSTRAYYIVRKYLLEMGRRFLQHGYIDSIDDIFMCDLNEVINVCQSQKNIDKRAIAYRRKMYQGYRNIEAPNEFGRNISQRLKTSYFEIVDGQACYHGIGCSPGVIEGQARVIMSIEEADQFKKGEILITKFTDPGWTPLLGIASAVVTEVGGVLSHAAVIGREYGIPVVLNIPAITNEIKSGDRVRVDGSEGVCILFKPSHLAGDSNF